MCTARNKQISNMKRNISWNYGRDDNVALKYVIIGEGMGRRTEMAEGVIDGSWGSWAGLVLWPVKIRYLRLNFTWYAHLLRKDQSFNFTYFGLLKWNVLGVRWSLSAISKKEIHDCIKIYLIFTCNLTTNTVHTLKIKFR